MGTSDSSQPARSPSSSGASSSSGAPSILVTNDDGIDSANLRALADALDQAFPGRIIVIAPESQQSATSHTITLHKPLRVHEVLPGRFSASGSPVDCVYLGLMRLAPKPVGLVISGINDGHNLGTDIFYSGTVAGAVEAGLRRVPGLAVSLAHNASEQLTPATELVVELAGKLLGDSHALPQVLNVNIPRDWNRKVRLTTLGRRFYQDDVHERTDPRGRHYYWIGGGIAGSDLAAGSDCEAVEQGVASITPLRLDLCDHGFIKRENERDDASTKGLTLERFQKG